MDLWSVILRWGLRGDTVILYGYYVFITTSAMSPNGMPSSKSIVVHSTINSSKSSQPGATFDHLLRKSKTSFSNENISTATNANWQLKLVRHPLHRRSEAPQDQGKIDFESISAQEDKSHSADTTTWIGRHHPFSVTVFANLIEQPIFLCNSNTRNLRESFVDALDGLAT